MVEEEHICLMLKFVNELLQANMLVFNDLGFLWCELGSSAPELMSDCESKHFLAWQKSRICFK
jgi:hypothetical protein